ncbi:MAG: type II toxin-antitoxin system VapC family toxin [Acetobacteraceae bacterium]|nr:type II toxin-antitoxin system VapC family toxin [Acetobacteraceae bacterium]
MILVDTSVWVDHLRGGDAVLVELLQSGEVVTHPFVIGELALGNLRHEDRILGSLRDLPPATEGRTLPVRGHGKHNSRRSRKKYGKSLLSGQ